MLFYSIQLIFSIQYITHPSIQFSGSSLFNSATRLYSIQELASIQFSDSPLFNRKEKRDSGYTHGSATASIDIGGNGGICEQSRLVNNHKNQLQNTLKWQTDKDCFRCLEIGRLGVLESFLKVSPNLQNSEPPSSESKDGFCNCLTKLQTGVQLIFT